MKQHSLNRVKKIVKLAKPALKIIDYYFNLRLGSKNVPCPYYINEDYSLPYFENGKVVSRGKLIFKKKRTKNRALIGKGSPSEIIKITQEFAKKDDFDLEKASVAEIRKFMAKHGVGIDCSAVVARALNEVTKEKFKKPLWKFINFGKRNFLRKILIRLRPIENISVKLLSSELNSKVISSLADIQPGDLLIAWNNQHVILITEVGFNKKQPAYFKYVNSTWWYGDKGGVKEGKVLIKNINNPLVDQIWLEDTYQGRNWTLEGFKDHGKVVRLRNLTNLF